MCLLSLCRQESLLVCCERRLPRLAGRRPLCAVIVDSVAAQFRCEYEPAESGRRARHIQTLGGTLRRLARRHRLAVICVNQVSTARRRRQPIHDSHYIYVFLVRPDFPPNFLNLATLTTQHM